MLAVCEIAKRVVIEIRVRPSRLRCRICNNDRVALPFVDRCNDWCNSKPRLFDITLLFRHFLSIFKLPQLENRFETENYEPLWN